MPRSGVGLLPVVVVAPLGSCLIFGHDPALCGERFILSAWRSWGSRQNETERDGMTIEIVRQGDRPPARMFVGSPGRSKFLYVMGRQIAPASKARSVALA